MGACRVIAGGVIALILLTAAVSRAQNIGAGGRVEGVVRDSSGAVVAGAQVGVHAAGFSGSTVSDSGGNFFVGGREPLRPATVGITHH